MEKKSLGFTGGGRITRIFLKALYNRQFATGRVIVYDPDREIIRSLKVAFPDIEITDDPDSVFKQDIVFIAVHPPVIPETLDRMKNIITGDQVVISLAPKFSIARISEKLGTGNIVRMIPNATSFINEGYNPLCFSPGFNADKTKLLDMLEVLGKTFEVPEEKLEAFAIISAMLPTYFWFQWQTLISLGVRMGMQESEACDALYETLIASLNIMFKSGENRNDVMDLIPVKPIGEHEEQIKAIFEQKLWKLFEKIRP